MIKKTLLMSALLLAVMLALPVTASAQSLAAISKADEKFLSEMPLEDFPDADYMADSDNDGIVDGEDSEPKTAASKPGGIPDPFAPKEKEENVKYIYKPGSDTTLRRTIQDDRIEDGYVQGLMQQRGPQ